MDLLKILTISISSGALIFAVTYFFTCLGTSFHFARNKEPREGFVVKMLEQSVFYCFGTYLMIYCVTISANSSPYLLNGVNLMITVLFFNSIFIVFRIFLTKKDEH
jgi:hypothetical protein